METNEKLNDLKEETENVSKKLHDLTVDELVQVSGGTTDTAPCGLTVCNYSSRGSCLYYKTVGGHVPGCKYAW